jgi:preprotein translocase subunit YajC
VEGLAQLVPFILIAVVFWLLLIRPQRRRQMEMLATQRAVAIGDEVLLGAGIVGRVAGEADDFLELEIAPGVAMKVTRGAVVRVLEPETLDPSLDEGEPADLVDPADPTDPTRDH